MASEIANRTINRPEIVSVWQIILLSNALVGFRIEDDDEICNKS